MDLPPDAGKKPLKSFVMALCSLTERTQNLWAQGRHPCADCDGRQRLGDHRLFDQWQILAWKRIDPSEKVQFANSQGDVVIL